MYTGHFRRQPSFNSRTGGRPYGRFARFGGGRGGGRRRGRPILGPNTVKEYIRKAGIKTSIQTPEIITEVIFKSLNLPERLLSNISQHGYNILTPIQIKGIPAIREGKDVIGIANTGTGKTAAFLIPLVEKILLDRMYGALIITPTRELALQIQDELNLFTNGLPIYNAVCIGKSPMYAQIARLKRNPHVVVGTPGRLKDLIERGILKLETFNMIVLDEADQMLDMGFINDIKEIISHLPPVRQSLFFSATVSSSINMLIQSFVKNPITISVKTQETVSNIQHEIIQVENGYHKMDQLITLLKQEDYKKVLVLGRTKLGVERLSRDLYSKGFKVASIHGDKAQFNRQKAIRMFKEDVVSILIATDVAARGLDIPNVSHVINYDIPETYEDYVHRTGRTGRADKTGIALTFVTG